MNSFLEIDRLKAGWDTLKPIPPDRERRLWQKLRLEWNYHSNHLNTATAAFLKKAFIFVKQRAGRSEE